MLQNSYKGNTNLIKNSYPFHISVVEISTMLRKSKKRARNLFSNSLSQIYVFFVFKR